MNDWILHARKRISRFTLLWLTRSVRLFSILVPYHFGVAAGGGLGFILYYLLPRERKRTIEHLESVFGDKGEQWVRLRARGCFVHLGKSVLEVMLMTPERMSRIVAAFDG